MSENGQTSAGSGVNYHTMERDPDACYRALLAHDARFDGVFFVGVKTTGIYCRPVCRARTPRLASCEFFAHAASAESAGFRACFRCRPERAPGTSNVDAVSRLVAAATRKIEEGALNLGTAEQLATSLGVSGRHLRRVMQQELGVGPIELGLSKRVALARELLRETALPITEIAFASGFSSVRRFNDAYRVSQRMTPSDVRRPRESHRAIRQTLRIVLDIRPPFDPVAAFAFLRARAVIGCELVFDQTYLRATSNNGATGIITISAVKGRDAVAVEVPSSLGPSLMTIAARTRRMFDSDADLSLIGAHLARDRALKNLIAARPALRVIGAFEPFEWAMRAVLGQQISVRAALTIASRLVSRLGAPLSEQAHLHPHAPTVVWPDAVRVANANEATLLAIGLSRARASTLLNLARAVADHTLVLDISADPSATRTALLAIPGVGPWTAKTIEMRALGWPDAFPANDLGLRKALGGLNTAECEARAEPWRPWRAYAAAHLWTGLTAR